MKGIAEESQTETSLNESANSEQYLEVTIEMQDEGCAVQSESVSYFELWHHSLKYLSRLNYIPTWFTQKFPFFTRQRMNVKQKRELEAKKNISIIQTMIRTWYFFFCTFFTFLALKSQLLIYIFNYFEAHVDR